MSEEKKAVEAILSYLNDATKNSERMMEDDTTPKEYLKGYTQVLSSIYNILIEFHLL